MEEKKETVIFIDSKGNEQYLNDKQLNKKICGSSNETLLIDWIVCHIFKTDTKLFLNDKYFESFILTPFIINAIRSINSIHEDYLGDWNYIPQEKTTEKIKEVITDKLFSFMNIATRTERETLKWIIIWISDIMDIIIIKKKESRVGINKFLSILSQQEREFIDRINNLTREPYNNLPLSFNCCRCKKEKYDADICLSCKNCNSFVCFECVFKLEPVFFKKDDGTTPWHKLFSAKKYIQHKKKIYSICEKIKLDNCIYCDKNQKNPLTKEQMDQMDQKRKIYRGYY